MSIVIEDVSRIAFIFGLILLPLLSITSVIACRMLQRMYDNEGDSENPGDSWTGPVRSSYIAILAAVLLFVLPSVLLANDRLDTILRIAIQVFSVMILMTATLLAGVVIVTKNAAAKNKLPIVGLITSRRPQKGRQTFYKRKKLYSFIKKLGSGHEADDIDISFDDIAISFLSGSIARLSEAKPFDCPGIELEQSFFPFVLGVESPRVSFHDFPHLPDIGIDLGVEIDAIGIK